MSLGYYRFFLLKNINERRNTKITKDSIFILSKVLFLDIPVLHSILLLKQNSWVVSWNLTISC